MLKDKLMDDLKAAMKAKDAVKKSTVTMLRAAIKQIEVDQRVELSDAEVVDIVVKQIKQKRAAIDDFKKAERPDMVEQTEAEISVLEAYLPEQLSSDEVVAIIDKAIAEIGATSMKDMGKVMGAIKGELAGKADNKFVADTVKAKLTQ
ncbi:MAG: aspartyl-tRNA amidotransferase [Clostridiales bacterium]|nr:MAG: aspartyl-tRNA amidotransferase [Clostridiales bacterium]